LIATLGVAIAILGAPAVASAGFELAFSSEPGATITFTPHGAASNPSSTFAFNPQASNTFKITSGGTGPVTGGPNSLNSLLGTITGSYNVGAISGTVFQTAAVTNAGSGAHQFVINDGLGKKLTADLTWIDINTVGAGGGINQLTASLNLTNFQYVGGTNLDLKSLATNTSGDVVVTFSFPSTRSLKDLATSGHLELNFYKTQNFSGSLGAPQGGPLPTPAPAGLVLALSGAPFLFVGRLLRRKKTSAAEGTALAV